MGLQLLQLAKFLIFNNITIIPCNQYLGMVFLSLASILIIRFLNFVWNLSQVIISEIHSHLIKNVFVFFAYHCNHFSFLSAVSSRGPKYIMALLSIFLRSTPFHLVSLNPRMSYSHHVDISAPYIESYSSSNALIFYLILSFLFITLPHLMPSSLC